LAEGRERRGSVRREAEEEQTIRRYLLSDIAPDERRCLEERLLDDGDDFFDQLQLAESELVDDYVTGDLSDADRARFREAFLSSDERREQLRFAELLRSHFVAAAPIKKRVTGDTRTSPSWLGKLARLLNLDRPAVGFALACSLVLAVCVAAAAGFYSRRLSRRLDELQSQRLPAPAVDLARVEQQLAEERARREAAAQELSHEQERRAALENEVARLRQGAQGEVVGASPAPRPAAGQPAQTQRRGVSAVLAVALSSGITRELGEMREVNLGARTRVVRLQLEVGDDDYKSFSAALEDADEKPLLVKDSLLPKATRGGRTVIFDAPAKLFAGGGDFQLQLSGRTSQGNLEGSGKYYFRVQRNNTPKRR
jgi:hypothetical protein